VEIPSFELERWQSEWENRVEYNLAESGVHPLTLEELLDAPEREALARLRLGYTQTNGTPELRAAIAAAYPGATSDNVLVTTGTSEANYVALWRLMEPGDEVVALLPNYMQLPGLVRGFGGRLVPVWMRPGASSWTLDVAELEARVSGRTRLIMICNPNNPTGAVLSEAEMAAVETVAARHGCWILSDEVYREAVLAPPAAASFWGRGERVLVTSGLSKAFGLPGLRVGWAVGAADLVAQLWGRRDYTTISPAALSDAIAIQVLEPARRARILDRTRTLLRENHGIVAEWLQGRSGLAWVPPRAGAIALVRYASAEPSAAVVQRALDAGVLVVPGAQFEMEGSLRLGFGIERTQLHAALQRLGPILDTLKV
jgi:aspartate/methionine/tyrosine aminotransferase